MQRREKILAVGLAALLGGWWLLPVLDGMFLAPLRDRENQAAGLSAEVAKLEESRRALIRARARIKEFQRTSLPPNVSEAHRQYQIWLTDMAQLCGLSDVQVVLPPRKPSGAVYVATPVNLKFKATYEQIVRFLTLLGEVDLAHQITYCKLTPESPDTPVMSCDLNMEGLSLPKAPARTRLFPEAPLPGDLSADAASLTAPRVDRLPAAPFRMKLDNELIDVAAVQDGVWSLQRGVAGTAPAIHKAGTIIECLPLRKPAPGVDPVALSALTPFHKPRPKVEYRPRLEPSGKQEFLRGTPLAVQLKVESWDPAVGAPEYTLKGDAPLGVVLDPATGALSWSPAADVAAGEFPVKVIARSRLRPEISVASDLVLKLRNPNHPPVFKAPTPPTLYLTQSFTLACPAEDEDAGDRLTYSLSGTPPAGATIDAASGLLSWTPAADLAPGDYTVVVTATDSGDPPQSASVTLTLHAEEDAAQFTRLAGCTNFGGRNTAMFYDRSTNQTFNLIAGDDFKFSEFQGKIQEVGDNYALLQIGETETHRVELGKSIREMLSKGALGATTPPSAPAAAAPVPGTPPASDATPPASEAPPTGGTPPDPGSAPAVPGATEPPAGGTSPPAAGGPVAPPGEPAPVKDS